MRENIKIKKRNLIKDSLGITRGFTFIWYNLTFSNFKVIWAPIKMHLRPILNKNL